MGQNIFQVTLPDGTIAERQSATRTYTHAVQCVDTEAARLARVERFQAALDKAVDAEAQLAKAAAATDEKEYAKIAAKYEAARDGKGSFEAYKVAADPYWAHPRTKHEAAVHAVESAKRDLERESKPQLAHIITWCGRLDLALKACASEAGKVWHLGQKVTVVETVRVEKAAKSAKRGVRR